jgi:hypothetical protein
MVNFSSNLCPLTTPFHFLFLRRLTLEGQCLVLFDTATYFFCIL